MVYQLSPLAMVSGLCPQKEEGVAFLFFCHSSSNAPV